MEFAEEVRDRFERVAPPAIHQPLPQNGFIDQGCAPQCAGEHRCRTRDLVDSGLLDIGDAAIGQRDDPVIHCVEYSDVEVAEIARDQKGGDAARAIAQNLVARRPPIENKMNIFRRLAIGDNVGLAGNIAHIAYQSCDLVSFSVGQRFDGFKLVDHRMNHVASPSIG